MEQPSNLTFPSDHYEIRSRTKNKTRAVRLLSSSSPFLRESGSIRRLGSYLSRRRAMAAAGGMGDPPGTSLVCRAPARHGSAGPGIQDPPLGDNGDGDRVAPPGDAGSDRRERSVQGGSRSSHA